MVVRLQKDFYLLIYISKYIFAYVLISLVYIFLWFLGPFVLGFLHIKSLVNIVDPINCTTSIVWLQFSLSLSLMFSKTLVNPVSKKKFLSLFTIWFQIKFPSYAFQSYFLRKHFLQNHEIFHLQSIFHKNPWDSLWKYFPHESYIYKIFFRVVDSGIMFFVLCLCPPKPLILPLLCLFLTSVGATLIGKWIPQT